MDSTTLTRTLAIMIREGWIAERPGQDRRERWLRLARGGKALLDRALPVWERVQSGLRRLVGERAWKDLIQRTNQMTELVTNLGGSL